VQLARAFNEVFTLAGLADRCCKSAQNASGNCDDQSLQTAPIGPNTDCGNLQAAFDRIAGPDRLSAQSFLDIQKFRPYQIYDHNQVMPAMNPTLFPTRGPTYSLRIRGVLEGVTGDGSIVGSTEWFQDISICANCGGSSACTSL
jgi:hypothetical protein